MSLSQPDGNVTEVSSEVSSVANVDAGNIEVATMGLNTNGPDNLPAYVPAADMDSNVDERTEAEEPAAPLASGDTSSAEFFSDFSTPSAVSGDRSSVAAMQPPAELDDAACLFVVQCAPEKDAWARVTCLMAFASAFIGDGVFLSLFLFDARYGIAGKVPAAARTLEHMAVYVLFFYAVGPFACALVNRHGFRTMMFWGSLLTIAWSACLWSIAEVFVDNRGLLLAAVGGTGAGLMRTSFTILLSLLFSLSRQKAHLCVHLGGFAGMMLVTPFTEYSIIIFGSKTAMMINMFTPVPQKIEVVGERSKVIVEHPVQTKSKAIAKNAQRLVKNRNFPTVWNTVGNRQLRVVPFTVDTPVLSRTDNLKSIGLGRMERLYTVIEPKMYYRNLTDLFGPTFVGSRPMYRDDVLFTGNIFHLLDEKLKAREFLYPLLMTRMMTVSDVKDELNGWTKLWPTSVSRTFNSIMCPNIWGNVTFMLYVAIEILVHAARFIPLIFIKGPPGMMKSSSEAVVTLIAGCYGMLAGRGLGFVMHETSATAVPIYTVGIVLIANGLSLFLTTTTEIAKIIPYFGIYGIFFGYYNSVQNALVYNVFPVDRLNNVFGYIFLVRALGSCFGILIAVTIQDNDRQSNETVYMFTGMLMFAAGICVGVLQPLSTARQTQIGNLQAHCTSDTRTLYTPQVW